MAGATKTGTLHDQLVGLGRTIVKIPQLPSVTMFYVNILSGAATIALEISDDNELFIAVLVVTESCAIQFAIPCSVVACNVTVNSGSVTVKYRTVVMDNLPSQSLLVYSLSGEVTSPIITPEQTILSASQIELKKLAQQEIPAAPTVVYTVPAEIQTRIEAMVLVSTSVIDQLVTLWHDGSGDSNIIFPPSIIPAGGHADFDGAITMEPGDTLVAECDAANAVTITAWGYEQRVPV